jgi:hypothetical protein
MIYTNLQTQFLGQVHAKEIWDSAVGIATGYVLDDRGV